MKLRIAQRKDLNMSVVYEAKYFALLGFTAKQIQLVKVSKDSSVESTTKEYHKNLYVVLKEYLDRLLMFNSGGMATPSIAEVGLEGGNPEMDVNFPESTLPLDKLPVTLPTFLRIADTPYDYTTLQNICNDVGIQLEYLRSVLGLYHQEIRPESIYRVVTEDDGFRYVLIDPMTLAKWSNSLLVSPLQSLLQTLLKNDPTAMEQIKSTKLYACCKRMEQEGELLWF